MGKLIQRHLTNKIISLLKQFKCLVLTGPRQVGKSTILKSEVLPNFSIFNKPRLEDHIKNFDDESIVTLAKNDPKLFMQSLNKPTFIDEIQKAPELFSYIKLEVDKYDDRPQFVLTGSESFQLMKRVNESLSTRTAIIEMNGLSQSEIFGVKNFVFKPDPTIFLKRKQPAKTQKEIFKYIMNGSMPDVHNGKIKDVENYYESYIKTSLFKDFREDWTKIYDFAKFRKFLSVIAALVGCELKYETIIKSLDIDKKTVVNWINGLVAMNIIFFLQPYSHNLIKRSVKSPKLYFYDTGLACHLMKYKDVNILLNSEYAGHIFESFAISEIIKGYINDAKQHTVYYLKDPNHTDNEIDLILEGEGGILYPVEIKKAVTVKEKHFKNIKLLKPLCNKVGAMTVISCADDFYSFGKDKYVLPVHWL